MSTEITKFDDAGDTIRVVRGMEKFSPIQFHTIDIGPFELTTTVKHGETREQAYVRAMTFLDSMARADFNKRKNDFLAQISELGTLARKPSR